MNESEWITFLKVYNHELLSYEEVIEALPKQLVDKGWLGNDGASESEVRAIEQKLKTPLPASYRAFLKVSNGWRSPSLFISELRPAAKIAWFKDENQDWIDIYIGPNADLPKIHDNDYFVYGPNQDCVNFRNEYLATALQISEVCDTSVVLLNPKITTPDGEWETWFFASWLPGATRYRSFGEWLATERHRCSQQLTPSRKAVKKKTTHSKKPASVKKAQSFARCGQTDLAIDSLESFASKNDDSAAASLAELYAFQGRWGQVISNAGRLIANPRAVYAGNVFDDMIRLIAHAGSCSNEWQAIIEVANDASAKNAGRDSDYQQEWHRTRHENAFQNLRQFAGRQGALPYELLTHAPSALDRMNLQERRAWYTNAVENVDTIRPDLKRNPQAKIEHFFSLAKGILDDEALKLYEEHGHNFSMAWQAAEHVARLYVQRGNPDAAWTAVSSNLSKWWPVDNAQVTPLILLVDEHLSTLMTEERCQFVLSTPRGPEAVKPNK